MTPSRTEFMAALERERNKRIRERCIKRKTIRKEYIDYRFDLFERQRRRYGL